MRNKTLLAVLVAVTLGLTACAGRRTQETPPAETAGQADAGAETAGVDQDAATAGEVDPEAEVPGPQEGLLSRRTIYFDFDSAEIRGEGTDIVAAHAKYLASAPMARLRLEGHTDERGSREYNIGLGERRAQAVRRALLLQGASDAQISTVSYGEERPAAAGSTEEAWSQNRRVELVYLTGPAGAR